MSRRAIFLGLLFCVLQSFADYEQGRRFIEGLTEEGFPNLAEKTSGEQALNACQSYFVLTKAPADHHPPKIGG
jgi:hypothetical protein